MIGLVCGTVLRVDLDDVVTVRGGGSGVGYEVRVSARTADALRLEVDGGGDVYLWTHTVVRETDLYLVGFLDVEERDFYRLLLTVQNVGPRLALPILDLGTPSDLADAIARQDIAMIQSAKGVGAKIAQAVVLHLAAKVDAFAQPTDTSPATREALTGLQGLGYSLDEARAMLSRAEGETAEELIASALRVAQ